LVTGQGRIKINHGHGARAPRRGASDGADDMLAVLDARRAKNTRRPRQLAAWYQG